MLHLLAGDEVADGVHEVALGVDYADYTARWAALAGELRTHRVPGNLCPARSERVDVYGLLATPPAVR